MKAAAGTAPGISVHIEPTAYGMPVRIEEPEPPPTCVHLRWRAAVHERWRILNDQWECSYAQKGQCAGQFCVISFGAYSSRRASMGWRREAREAGA